MDKYKQYIISSAIFNIMCIFIIIDALFLRFADYLIVDILYVVYVINNIYLLILRYQLTGSIFKNPRKTKCVQ